MATAPPVSPSPIPNYRQQIRRALPDHVFQPDPWGIWWFLPHLALIGGSLAILTLWFQWWLAPILALVIGHSFACLGFLAHEIAHGALTRAKWSRDLLAGMAFSAFAISPLLWRKWHNADHHNNTQIIGVDPDHLFTMEHYETNKVLQGLYRLHPFLRNLVIFGSFTFRMTQQTTRMLIAYLRDKDTTGAEKLTMLWQTLLPYAFWIGLTALLGWQVLVFGYLIPLLVANTIAIAYIATNHFLNPLADERDVLATSLTVTLPRGLRWLDPWHQCFGAHVAHHLFPQIPAKHARLVEDKVAELFPDRYHSMSIFRALKALWDTPWVYEDHTTLVDPRRQERHKVLGHGMEEKIR